MHLLWASSASGGNGYNCPNIFDYISTVTTQQVSSYQGHDPLIAIVAGPQPAYQSSTLTPTFRLSPSLVVGRLCSADSTAIISARPGDFELAS